MKIDIDKTIEKWNSVIDKINDTDNPIEYISKDGGVKLPMSTSLPIIKQVLKKMG